MNSKKANWLFLSVILTHLGVVILLIAASRFFTLHIIPNLLLSELILLVPTLLFLACTKGSLLQKLRFRRMKISTLLMVVLFTYLTMPLTTLVNIISMIFVDNTVVSLGNEVVSVPFIVMLFLMAVYGPFCEELAFRGAIYGGYRKDGKRLSAVILSGLLFGLMHMNLNQAAYAFVVGILLALLVEATGSLWSSVLYHFLFNAQAVCLLFLVEHMMPDMLENASDLELAGDMLYYEIGVYLILAAVSTVCAVMTLIWMARNEGRLEEFRAIFTGREQTDIMSFRSFSLTNDAEQRQPWPGEAAYREERRSIVTLPLVIACLICIAYIALDTALS